MAITFFSYFVIPNQWADLDYVYFVGSSTLLLYSLHRIIGIKKSESYSDQGRFAIIIKYKSHLIVYAFLSGLLCMYLYYTFDWNRRLLLIVPTILSLSYSLPIFLGGKRLRDFHWIKIFLIAFCWAIITFTIPIYEINAYSNFHLTLLTLERSLFIFALTIPFDIRDRKIDNINQVKTLATEYQDSQLKIVSWISLGIATIIVIICYHHIYKMPSIITYVITAFLIFRTDENKNDYFFTGKLDGMMMMPLIICIIVPILLLLLFS